MKNNKNSPVELAMIREFENREDLTIIGGYDFQNWACDNCTCINYTLGNAPPCEAKSVHINWNKDSIKEIQEF